MILVLWPSAQQERELEQLLDEQQRKSSPNYHRWLSAAEFGARFGTADTDTEQIRTWLESKGFAVGTVSKSKRWIVFSGTSQQVEDAFHTEMQYYRVSGKTHIANATDIAVPVALAEVTRGLASLNNFGKRPPRHLAEGAAGRDSEGRKTLLEPNLTAATNTYYLAPGDFAAVYDTKSLLGAGIDGTGISIAITAQSDIELTDVQEFRQIFRLKANDPNFIVSGPDPGLTSQTDAEEAQLDVEWAGAVAPGATIDLVVAGSSATTSGVDLAAAYAIDNEIAPILTYTYGSCEQALGAAGNAFYNALWQQAAAEGITVLVAAGDNGAAGCDNATAGIAATQGLAVNGAASTPYNIAVGGTEFTEGATAPTYWNSANAPDFSSSFGYIPESAWNEGCDPAQPVSRTNCVYGSLNVSLLAGGGGASTIYSKPAWQTGPGVPADKARDLPDVAMAAASGHDGFVYCTSLGGMPCRLSGQSVTGLTLIGGTSAATPTMAGILALVEQKNGAFQGQANYVLYQLAQIEGNSCDSSKQTNPAAHATCVFYDVTSGSNAVPCAGGSPRCSSTASGTNGFLTGNAAGPGYDLATGLGSVEAANLANAWENVVLAGSQTTLQTSTASFVHGSGAKTSTTLAVQSAPINLGDTGIFHVTVNPASATGTVSLWDAVGARSSAFPISGGAARVQLAWTQAGSTSLYAVYSGDQANAGSVSAPITFTVHKGVPQIQLSAPASDAATQPLSLNARVIGSTANAAIPFPSGIIEIWDSLSGAPAQLLAAQNPTRGAGSVAVLGTHGKLSPGSHTLHAHYDGDVNWAAGDSPNVTLVSSSFTLLVSPTAVPVTAGALGNATVLITPNGGFSGTVALSCPTGGTLAPVGYTCSFGQASVPVSGGQATTQLNLTPSTTPAAALKTATLASTRPAAWGLGSAAAILLLGMAGIAASRGKGPRDFLLFGGLVAGIVSLVLGCGSGGSSTGPVATTTTLSSSALKVGFGTPVTFSVLVVPQGSRTPTGNVQLFDNGTTYGNPSRVNAGIVSFLTTNLPVGVHVITAQYLGDASTLGSSSAPITQVITGTVPMQITGTSNSIVETADFNVSVN
jgi:hypothetical protein